MKNKKNLKGTMLRVGFAILVGFINGFFGGGGGLILVPVLQKIYKLETKKAHATAILIMLPLSVVSSIIYIIRNDFNINVTALVCLGVLLGGFIGAIFLKKFNEGIVRWIFVIVLFASGVRMVAG